MSKPHRCPHIATTGAFPPLPPPLCEQQNGICVSVHALFKQYPHGTVSLLSAKEEDTHLVLPQRLVSSYCNGNNLALCPLDMQNKRNYVYSSLHALFSAITSWRCDRKTCKIATLGSEEERRVACREHMRVLPGGAGLGLRVQHAELHRLRAHQHAGHPREVQPLRAGQVQGRAAQKAGAQRRQGAVHFSSQLPLTYFCSPFRAAEPFPQAGRHLVVGWQGGVGLGGRIFPKLCFLLAFGYDVVACWRSPTSLGGGKKLEENWGRRNI